MSRFTRTLTSAAIATLAIAGQAFAHAHLESSVPADQAVVKTAPTELDLTFSEELNPKFTGITVTGPDQKAVKTGEAMLMDDDQMLMVPVSDTLAPGTYTVEWHALSADGHKSKGKYSFTIKP
jgi:methionine-rich copper-binding protein CopC